jgi:predicted neuraminidase
MTLSKQSKINRPNKYKRKMNELHFERRRTCEKWKKANGFSNVMQPMEEHYAGCVLEPLYRQSHGAFLFAWPLRPSLVFCARFSGHKEGASRCAIIVSSIDISGATSPRWSEPVIASVCDEKSFQNPVLFVMRDEPQRLYLVHTAQDAGRIGVSQQSAALLIVHSDDFGATWSSSARTLVAVGRGAFTRGPVLQTDNSTVLPVYFTPDGTFEHERQYSALLRLVRDSSVPSDSNNNNDDDDDRSLSSVAPLVSGDQVMIAGSIGAKGVQPIALRSRIDANRVLVFLRSRSTPHIQFTQSNDGGASFEPLRATIFPNNNSGIGATFVGRYLVLAFNNCTGRRRFPLTLAVSADEGATWLRVRDVVDVDRCNGDARPGEFSYPSVLGLDDSRFMLAWSHRRESIAVGLFDLDWLLRGGDGRSCSTECSAFARTLKKK